MFKRRMTECLISEEQVRVRKGCVGQSFAPKLVIEEPLKKKTYARFTWLKEMSILSVSWKN